MLRLLTLIALTLTAAAQPAPDYTVTLDTVMKGYDGKTCRVHPRCGIIPGDKPAAVMTMLNLTVTGSDLFSPTWDTRSDDLGKTWSEPVEHKETLGHRAEPNGVECGICDFTPQWHAASGKLLAIGQTVRYKNNKLVENRPRETAYSVYDTKARTWSLWKTVKMPEDPRYYNAGAGSVQRYDLPDGSILLPIYYKLRGTTDACAVVMKCKFDGVTLTVEKFGNELAIKGSRGFGEPSLTFFKNRYYLTLRNDQAGYVTSGTDGLNFDEPKKWCFDDGSDLGNYNTQQHWVTHPDGLFLVYTRKGANNDHVFRHRAPLFMAQVDPAKMQVIRATEKILVPERDARLGNFGVTVVSPEETWVTVAEWMQTWAPKKIIPVDNPKGADNSVYIARIRWKKPEVNNERKKALERPRRILFNNDGGETAIQMKTATEQEFLDLRTTMLAGTHVDSIFYCTRTSGFGVFTHHTKIGQVFTCTDGRYAGNMTGALLAAGLDPLKMQCDFGKKHNIEVFWSMRMNDTHDGSKADYGPIMFKDNKLKNEHPEYLLGTIQKPLKHGAWSGVNYAVPEVRELAFRYFEEVCRNYDITGIELDFFRHPVFFKSTGKGEPVTPEELAAMTELIRRIRKMTEEVGAKRGKPILIAVKCPDSVEYCKLIGLDLETWMSEGLFDMYIPGGYFQINNWEYSVKLAKKHGLKVYPSLDDTRLKDETANKARTDAIGYRGRAAAAWAAGADGIYLFNFNDTKPNMVVLKELGDPKVLTTSDRDYFASPRGAGKASGGNLPYDKHLTLETLNPAIPKLLKNGAKATAKIETGESADDMTARTITLRVRIKNPPAKLSLAAEWNGKPVELTAAEGEWFECKLDPAAVKPGINLFELSLAKPTAKPVEWIDLTLEVRPVRDK